MIFSSLGKIKIRYRMDSPYECLWDVSIQTIARYVDRSTEKTS